MPLPFFLSFFFFFSSLSRRSRRHAWISGTGSSFDVEFCSRTEESEKSHSGNVAEILELSFWTTGTSTRGPKRQACGGGGPPTQTTGMARRPSQMSISFALKMKMKTSQSSDPAAPPSRLPRRTFNAVGEFGMDRIETIDR
ncbi:uncharacterized protein LOC144006516 [Festucalex cinctus]